MLLTNRRHYIWYKLPFQNTKDNVQNNYNPYKNINDFLQRNRTSNGTKESPE